MNRRPPVDGAGSTMKVQAGTAGTPPMAAMSPCEDNSSAVVLLQSDSTEYGTGRSRDRRRRQRDHMQSNRSRGDEWPRAADAARTRHVMRAAEMAGLLFNPCGSVQGGAPT